MANGTFFPAATGDGSSFIQFPNGTLIQWGKVDVTIASGTSYKDMTITYPVAFNASTVNPVVVVSNAADGSGTSSQGNVCIPSATGLNESTKLTSFRLRTWKQASIGSANNPQPVITWMAFGRWK